MAGVGLTLQKPITIFIAVLLALLILMSYQVKDEATGRTMLGSVIFSILSPVQMGISTTVRGAWNTAIHYFDLVNTNEENVKLTKEVAELKVRIQANAREKEENQRLRSILKLEEEIPMKILVGEVIGGASKAGVSTIVSINRGSRNGVKPQLAIVTPDGAVGKTVDASSLTAKVQLISDPSFSMGAMLERSGSAGILSGNGELCILEFLPLSSDVKPDDPVISSGQDGIFPEGYPIGRISRVMKSQLSLSAEVTPYQNLASLKEIVILLETTDQQSGQSK
jgi:rod shape-determining protein MreC